MCGIWLVGARASFGLLFHMGSLLGGSSDCKVDLSPLAACRYGSIEEFSFEVGRAFAAVKFVGGDIDSLVLVEDCESSIFLVFSDCIPGAFPILHGVEISKNGGDLRIVGME